MKALSLSKKTLHRVRMPLQVLWVLLILMFMGLALYSNRHILTDYEWNINITFLIYSILFALLRRFWSGIHWAYLISVLSKTPFFSNVFHNLRIYFITNLAAYLPGSVWYIPWRVQMNKKRGIGIVNTSVASVIETTLLVISDGLVGLPVLFLWASSNQTIDVRFLIGVIGLGLVAIHPWSIRLAFKLLCYILGRQLEAPDLKFKQMLVLVGFMLARAFTAGASLFFLIKSFYPDISLDLYPFVTSAFALAWVIGFLTPIAPSGLGVREGLLTWLFSFYIPLPVATIVALSSRFVFIVEDVGWILIISLLSGFKISGYQK